MNSINKIFQVCLMTVLLLTFVLGENALAVPGLFDNVRARYFTDPDTGNEDAPEVKFPVGPDSDGDVVEYLPNGLCVYRNSSNGNDPVLSGALFQPAAEGVVGDPEASGYDEQDFNTLILQYWGSWTHIPGVCLDPDSNPDIAVDTNMAFAVPRIKLFNTQLLSDGITVRSRVIKYTDQYEDGRFLLNIIGGFPFLVTTEMLTVGANTVWDQGGGENGHVIEFKLTHPAFGNLISSGIPQTAVLGVFASFQPLNDGQLDIADILGFPPAELQMSTLYEDTESAPLEINSETPSVPLPPNLFASTLSSPPADVHLNWNNAEENYDNIRIYRDGYQILEIENAADVEEKILTNEPIDDRSYVYNLIAVRFDGDEELLSPPSNSRTGPVLRADPPTNMAAEGGENQIVVSGERPVGIYAQDNEIIAVEICAVNQSSNCNNEEDLILSKAPPFTTTLNGLPPGTYQVSARVVLANGVRSDFSPTLTGIIVDDPFITLDPPPVQGDHDPVMVGGEPSTNPNEFYRVTFSLPAEFQSGYDRAEIYDGVSGTEIGELKASNGYSLTLPVNQVGDGDFFTVGYLDQYVSPDGGVAMSSGIPIIRPDVFYSIKANGSPWPNAKGRVLEVHATTILPTNLPFNPFNNRKLRIQDIWTEEPVDELIHEFPLVPGSQTVFGYILYPADLSGWGPHTLTADIFVKDSAGNFLAESPNNTTDLRLGVRPWNVNHGAPYSSDEISTFFHENAPGGESQPYAPGDFIFYFFSLSMADVYDESAGYQGPEPRCLEVTNSNKNRFTVRRKPTPAAPDECQDCQDFVDSGIFPNVATCESALGEGFRLCRDNPWNNTEASKPSDPWARCLGPNFNGTDLAGNPIKRSNPTGGADLLLTEEFSDWYDDGQDDLQNWAALWFPQGAEERFPQRGKPPGFYGPKPPSSPGECVQTLPGHWVCYDANNSCMTDYVHNEENGAYNQYGIPCVDETEQVGFPIEWEAQGDQNGMAL